MRLENTEIVALPTQVLKILRRSSPGQKKMKKNWSKESMHILTIPDDNYFLKGLNVIIVNLFSSLSET